jgi:uncharacterized protein YcbX
MRTISKLSVTPVKSLALHHPDELRLETHGAVGNRTFYLVDERGALFTGTKHGPLVRIRANHDDRNDRLTLSFPDGRVIEDSSAGLDGEVETSFYGRPVRGREVRGPFADALSDYAGRTVRLIRPDRAGEAIDVWPVSILSVASVEELGRRSGSDVPRDARRFRMLIEVDGCPEPHEEDTWAGRQVRLGEALVRVPGPIPRCAVTTQDPSSGLRDFATLHEIKAYRGLRNGDADDPGDHIDFGVYGEVLEPGWIRVGDPVEPLPD